MPSRALLRAIVWRRLAATRRWLAPSGRSRSDGSTVGAGRPPASQPAGTAGPRLIPVLVDYFGRDGSTAMMALLASSPQIVVEGRYPYEARPYAQLLETVAVGSGEADPEAVRTAIEAAWSERSRALLGGAGRAGRFYAEKLVDARRFDRALQPSTRLIVMLRDPRDTFVSVESFSRAVGAEEIGGAGGDEVRLERFVARQRERLRWIATLEEGRDTLLVDYRDLATDLAGVAERTSAWLDVELAPERVARDFRLRWVHGTSPEPAGSIGRWRRELDPGVAEVLVRELGPEMDALGLRG